MAPKEIAAEVVKAVRAADPLACPTCGTKMNLVLVGFDVNAVYVARCSNVTVPHPTWICLPTMSIEE